MADQLVEVHGRCGERFAALVDGIGADQWHDPTPCDDWDVRELVHHLMNEQRWVPPMFDGKTIADVGDALDGDLLGEDQNAWARSFASAMDEAHRVITQPGMLDRTVHLSFADVDGREYVTELLADLAIHAWDLARATGQDDTLDAEAVAIVLPWTEANAGLLAGSGMFGTSIDVGNAAPDDVRLLGLLGRKS
jgi:uncharacterized protein (TIGR03086 family)